MSPTVFSKHGLLWACNLSTGLTVHHTHTHTHTHREREWIITSYECRMCNGVLH